MVSLAKELEGKPVHIIASYCPITYVPYYLVFDQKGTLVKNHMAGIFHGGDKDTYQTIVKNLLVNQ